MKQNELNRAVAKATGETISEVDRRGFQLVATDEANGTNNKELDHYLDWDAVELSRQVTAVQRTAAVAS